MRRLTQDNRGVGAAGQLGDLAVAIARGQEQEVAAFARLERVEAPEPLAVRFRGDRALERVGGQARGLGELVAFVGLPDEAAGRGLTGVC
jgi:hypothetical protein